MINDWDLPTLWAPRPCFGAKYGGFLRGARASYCSGHARP